MGHTSSDGSAKDSVNMVTITTRNADTDAVYAILQREADAHATSKIPASAHPSEVDRPVKVITAVRVCSVVVAFRKLEIGNKNYTRTLFFVILYLMI